MLDDIDFNNFYDEQIRKIKLAVKLTENCHTAVTQDMRCMFCDKYDANNEMRSFHFTAVNAFYEKITLRTFSTCTECFQLNRNMLQFFKKLKKYSVNNGYGEIGKEECADIYKIIMEKIKYDMYVLL